jgi:hypothetical protein
MTTTTGHTLPATVAVVTGTCAASGAVAAALAFAFATAPRLESYGDDGSVCTFECFRLENLQARACVRAFMNGECCGGCGVCEHVPAYVNGGGVLVFMFMCAPLSV